MTRKPAHAIEAGFRPRRRGRPRHLHRGVLLVVLALFLPRAQPASGFELLRVSNDPCDDASRNLAWPAARVTVDVRLAGDAAQATRVRQAWSLWNSATVRFRFTAGSGSRCNFDDGVVTVELAPTTCDGSTFGDALAVTRSRWRSDGELVDAAVVVNSDAEAATDPAVFSEVVMHELGHVLGLDHSDACGRSGSGTLMKSTLILSAPRLTRPQTDDVAGANFIYPGQSGTVPAGANSCAIAPASRSGGGGYMLVLPLILVFAWRRVTSAKEKPGGLGR